MVYVDIVIPVLNEQVALPICIEKLQDYISSNIRETCNIIIADNGSDDDTPNISRKLTSKYKNLSYIRIPERGRGLALKTVWGKSEADIVCYMDVDLSTDLKSLPSLINNLVSDYDIAIGSRLSKGSKVTDRSFQRGLTSRGYNMLLKLIFFNKFHDAQCGFKGLRTSVAKNILPLIKDNKWFFDTELLLIAEKSNYRIINIPVSWKDDKDSRVNVVKTIIQDLKGMFRLRFLGIEKVN
jgi:glycosyltransferase involved in cell wall biosynthesis